MQCDSIPVLKFLSPPPHFLYILIKVVVVVVVACVGRGGGGVGGGGSLWEKSQCDSEVYTTKAARRNSVVCGAWAEGWASVDRPIQ